MHCRLRNGKTFKVGTGFKDREREATPPVVPVVGLGLGLEGSGWVRGSNKVWARVRVRVKVKLV